MIPEPTTSLWPELRRMLDNTFPIWVDEDAAFRLAQQWQRAADVLESQVTTATDANNKLPAVWRDINGTIFHSKVDRMLNSRYVGTAKLVEGMRQLSSISDQYARTIVQVKNQIYAELIANVVAFAASFALPPGLGDLARRFIIEGAAGRIAAFVAAAAARMAAAAPRLTKFALGVANEMIEEPLVDLTGQALDMARGVRDSIDWGQVGQAAAAGGVGALVNIPVAPIGRVITAPVRGVTRVLPSGLRKGVNDTAEAIVANGISSPVSNTIVQAVAEGRNPFGEDYLKAIYDQGLGAGLLGGSRIVSHQGGHSLGDVVFDRGHSDPGGPPPGGPPSEARPAPAVDPATQGAGRLDSGSATQPGSQTAPTGQNTSQTAPSGQNAGQQAGANQAAPQTGASHQGGTSQQGANQDLDGLTRPAGHAVQDGGHRTQQTSQENHHQQDDVAVEDDTTAAPAATTGPEGTDTPGDVEQTPGQTLPGEAGPADAPGAEVGHAETVDAPGDGLAPVEGGTGSAAGPAHTSAHVDPNVAQGIDSAPAVAPVGAPVVPGTAPVAGVQAPVQLQAGMDGRGVPQPGKQAKNPGELSESQGGPPGPPDGPDTNESEQAPDATESEQAGTPDSTESELSGALVASAEELANSPEAAAEVEPESVTDPTGPGTAESLETRVLAGAVSAGPGPGRPAGRVVNAPEGPGFAAGETAAASNQQLAEAAQSVQAEDFGFEINGELTFDAGHMVLDVEGLGPMRFAVGLGSVAGRNVAQTTLGADGVHETVIDSGVRADQLARALVHEISHSVRELLRVKAGEHGHTEDACIEAALDERRLVERQIREAKEIADRTGRAEDRAVEEIRRRELELLDEGLAARMNARQELAGQEQVGRHTVQVGARAGGKSLRSEAVQQFSELLNERDANGRLTPRAKVMRQYYFAKPHTGQNQGNVNRHGDAKPGRETFPVRTSDGVVQQVGVPVMNVTADGDFVPKNVEVVPGRRFPRIFVPFTHSDLGHDAAEIADRQDAVDLWNDSATETRRPVEIQMSDAELQAWNELSAEQRQEILDGLRQPEFTGKRSTTEGEWVGELFAESMLRWLGVEARSQGLDVYRVFFAANGGAGRMDQLYIRVDKVTREIRGFDVVEAKGPGGKPVPRRGLDLVQYLQGHPEYLDSLLTAIREDVHRPEGLGNEAVAVFDSFAVERVALPSEHGGPDRVRVRPARPEVATPITTMAELVDAIKTQAELGNVRYFMVKAKVSFSGGKVVAEGIIIDEYDMSGLKITGGPGTVHAPKRPGIEGNSRGPGAAPAVDAEVMDAARTMAEQDFGGLINGKPQVDGNVVTVETAFGRHEFRLEEGRIPGDKIAQTTLSTDGTPHRTRIDRTLRTDQLTRAWVHEISHALHEMYGPMNLQTSNGPVTDACAAAQVNEHSVVARQLSNAREVAEQTGRPEDWALEAKLRLELEASRRSLEQQGLPVPKGPESRWFTPADSPAQLGPVRPGFDEQAERDADGDIAYFNVSKRGTFGRNEARWEVGEDGRLRRAVARLREDYAGYADESDRGNQGAGKRKAVNDKYGFATDSGGHLLAWRFFQNDDFHNLFAQNANFNSAAYNQMEEEWGALLKQGLEVEVVVMPRPGKARPDAVDVVYTVIDTRNGGEKIVEIRAVTFDNVTGQVYVGLVQTEALHATETAGTTYLGVNEVVRTEGPDGVVDKVVATVRATDPKLKPAVEAVGRAAAARSGIPLDADGNVLGYRLFGPGGIAFLLPDGATVDPVEYARLEEQWLADIAAGKQVVIEVVRPRAAGQLVELRGTAEPKTEVNRPNRDRLAPIEEIRARADRVSDQEFDWFGRDSQAGTARTAIQQALNPNYNPHGHPKPPPGPHYSREVRGSRFVVNGRAATEGALDLDAVLDAAATTRQQDFGGLLEDAPHRYDDLVVVRPAGLSEDQHFRVEIGPVRRGRMAATYLHAGTIEDPHVVHIAPGIANDQLGRVWVHEISHALHAFHGHGSRVTRVLARVTGAVEDACMEAQFNELRLLSRQYGEAVAAGDQSAIDVIRNDIEQLNRAIARFGHTPPAVPWTDAPAGPVDFAAAHQEAANRAAELRALERGKRQAIKEAEKAAKDASKEARKAAQERDEGRHRRVREKLREAESKRDVAAWHRRRMTAYRRAAREAELLRDKYAEVLRLPEDQRAAHLTELARRQAKLERELAPVLPPRTALSDMLSVGNLPGLAELAEKLNKELHRLGIDHRFTAADLQLRLNSGFGQLVTADGIVLRVGAGRPAELRIALDIADLREVLNPGAKPSQLVHAETAQGGRRIGTAGTSRFTLNASQSLRDLTRLVMDQIPSIGSLGEFVTLRIDGGFNRSRALGGSAAAYAQDGATEDNRGEAVLFEGQGRWNVQVRESEFGRWRPVEPDLVGAPVRGWVSHAYTVPAPANQVSSGPQPAGPLPELMVSSIDGLQRLTDKVSRVFGGPLSSFGEQARDLREQIQEALTQDLPSRLSESTGRPIIRPLTADGRPVGHLEIRTVVKYVRTELVGAQSEAHWQERDRTGFRSASWSQSFGTGVSGKGAVEVGAAGFTDLAGTDSAYVAEASAGRDAGRSESQSAGGSALHIGVHRFVGPTQGYQLVLTHEVSLVLNGQRHGTVPSDSIALVRMRVDDAYRHGLKVSSDAIVRDAAGKPRLDPNGNPYLRGDVLPDAIAGRRMELPEWAKPGVGSGPALVQRVTGTEGAIENVIRHLAERGFLPPMTPDGRIDVELLTTDPLERQAQLANLEELTAQLAPNRLEAGYDGAVRDGLLVELVRTRTAAPTETTTLRIQLVQDPAAVRFVGTTSDEAMVALNIGSESAGRTTSRSKGMPVGVKPFGLKDSEKVDGQGGSLGVSLGRNAFGRGMSSLTGGTVNQVTLLESGAPLAVFELGHRLVVSEVQQDSELVIHDAQGTARVLIDSDLLPLATMMEEAVTAQLTPAVLQRILVLAVQNPDLLSHLPAELLNDPLTRELVQNFLDPRNLIAHPEWTGTTYRSGAITAPGSIAGRHQLGLRGIVGNVRLVSVTDGVGADINLGLGNQGASVAWSAASNGSVSDSVAVDGNPQDTTGPNGGGVNGGGSRSYSAGRTQQLITGIERSAIDTGRHYVFVADTTVTLNVDTAAARNVYDAGNGQLHFQIGETEALRFYINGKLKLPLEQVADAVERYLNGSLPLDARTAAGLVRAYRIGLSKSTTPPALAVHHGEARIIAALTATDPDLGQFGDRLAAVLPKALRPSTATVPVPPQYRYGFGGSVIESVAFTDALDDTSASPVLDAVREVARRVGVRVDSDGVLAPAMFADLAGKRWWGRIDDMLGGRGFVRTYAIEHGQHAGSHVTVRVTAVLSDEATELGTNPGLLSSNQRFLFDDRASTTTHGRTLSGGATGTAESGMDGSTATDREQGSSRAFAETHSRMERVSEFSGLTRIGRRIKLKIEVTHDPSPAPTNGRLRSRLQPTEERPGLIVSDEIELHGTLVQHLPTGLAKTKLGPVVPAQPGSVPETVWVETVGAHDSEQLTASVIDGLTAAGRFGRSGVELHRAEIEAQLAPTVLNAAFTRMTGAEGVRFLRLSVPSQASVAVDVVIRAVPVQVQEVSEISPDGELGIVDRAARTVSTSTSVGRLLSPPTGASHVVGETGFKGGFTGGDQRSDQVTDTRGIRRERHRLENGDLVTVRVEVRYEIALVPVRVLGFDPTRPDRPGAPINLPAILGEVYLTGHHHEIGVNP
ncbi:hypothetical protein E1263_06165 [Kribbella antibiotica]|uniref:DUF4157 domain-containing protein n=1 Tax=Kribbella antibiotica TaxID=190195 RepID=A0A4R4ZUD0_9ACTN|nr:DNA/RNA non-specific endonuclease [Kribbella antibiotica]TDD61774.1 hypothetical protein E1263_06165 [Kribbella antibiotica]